MIRYGVVDYKVFLQDLSEWKKLTVSTMMQKPHEVLIENPKIESYQETNLISAICVSTLLNLKEKEEITEVPEKDFFIQICKIPHIKSI